MTSHADTEMATGPDGYLLGDVPVTTLAAYEEAGGGKALQRALGMSPVDVVSEVAAAGVRGRGGAGFPTGAKWRSIIDAGASAESPVYLVCNAAEGEPGTYKDRLLVERNPFQLLEGMLVALYALGAEAAFVGIKQKSATAHERLVAALEALRAAGWKDADRVEVVAGPDEYLFGEEKALLEVLEGKLPMPRILPPYMQGLFATMNRPHPTAVNNVETLCHVTHVLRNGADWFRGYGTQEAPGTMLFTVIGDVAREGVYELSLGTSLRTLLVDIAGAEDIKAVYSGVSNPVILPDLLDLPMDFDSFAEGGTGLGSGGFVVYNSAHCMVRVAATIAQFLAIESCGQCLACKLGTAEIARSLAAIDRGEGDDNDIERILDRSTSVTDLARCGLPVGAQVLRTTITAFADEFVDHLGRPCPSTTPAVVPKIEAMGSGGGGEPTVRLDWEYYRKRDDWSYAEPGVTGTDGSVLTVPEGE